jgi:3D (Asp-Asp-Asp) domain-containing protein
MADVLIGTVSTNTTSGSVAQVVVEDLICTIKIINNAFGDKLPIIPKTSNVENEHVLYHMKLLATLTGKDGAPAAATPLVVVSNRRGDKIAASGTTDAKGEMTITLESRLPGALEMSTTTAKVTLAPYKITLKEAWYEKTFKITGYNVCLEDDFKGELTEGKGLIEKHKSDFLYSVAGIPMQGTGKASNGKLIGLKKLEGDWHRNAKGNRDYIEDHDDVTFQYLTGYGGKWKPVTVDHSIAVDPRKIPPLSKVNIEGVGDRYADDTGSMIVGYHIDNFLGAGKQVASDWLKGGINGTERKVKFLGYP